MAKLHGKRNTVLAGSLVLMAIVGCLVAIIVLGGALEVLGKREYIVRFPMETGVGGLVEGSAVQVGGFEVGAVRNVTPVIQDGVFAEALDVHISIDDRVRFRQGARGLLQRPLVGGLSSINFRNLGDPDAPVLDEGAVLPGAVAPAEILASAGYGERQADALRELIEAAREGAANFRDVSTRLRDDVTPRIDNIFASVENDYPTWSQDVTATLDSVNRATTRAPDIAQDIETAINSIRQDANRATDAIVSNGAAFEDTLATMTGFIDELEQSRNSAESFLRQLDEDLAPAALTLVQDTQNAIAEADAVVERAAAVLGEQSPTIRRTLANVRLASQELRFFTAEVRRSPWRLLYRPDQRELEYELLYDTARRYAAAIADLRETTASLEAVLASDNPRLAGEGADVEQLVNSINDAAERYRQAEQLFMDELMQRAGDD